MSEQERSEDELDDKLPAGEDAPAAEAEATGGDAGDAAMASAPESSDASAEVDSASPEAIARRVDALDGEDASERLAREEERRLAERRAGAKKKSKKKGGLEAAASKKLAKIGTRTTPKRAVAVAADADPLIERTAKLSEWAKKNQAAVQVVGAAVVLVLLGVAGFLWYGHEREMEASQTLAKAVAAQRAQIGEPSRDDDDNGTLYYDSFAERRTAALAKYRDVLTKFPGTGAAILARLAEGSLLLDQRDHVAALAAFTDVKGSALAAADLEVKGRALEGLGFAHELAATADAAAKDKHLDAALATYKELETAADVKGFKELAMYHQARVLIRKGDTDKAKELLVSLKTRFDAADDLGTPGLPPPPSFPYLREVALDRLRELDPNAVPKTSGMGGLSPAQIRKLMDQAQQQGGEP